ncbi:MAG TPA: TonB-dependent receptor [Steroidobacter sp.]|uniref:TonB-dependent receptor plug domain-containing protein n=1 Tax=Steroidobacter sp. TaxID=1978227 RepID=UPI002EDB202D
MAASLVHSSSRVGLAIVAAFAWPHGSAQAAEGASLEERTAGLEQIIVTGTRRAERTVLESNVPIDVVSNDDLRRTATPDLNSKLQAAVPSYNVRRLPTSDGSIFVRPASLRNLSPDHTLVMVNGKRFHRSAFVDVTARGAQAVNLALLPANAFKRTEVLRDGAAAQYGSDAIAGVINFILNDEPGTDTYVQFGEYSGGDGQNLQVGWSSGFELGDSGHLNFAAEYIDADATNNGRQRPQAELIAAQGEPYASAVRSIGKVVQRYGLPEQETKKVFVNAGFNLTESTQLYTFGSFADDTGVADFNYRPSLTVTGPNADGNIVTFARNGGYNIKANGRHSIYQTAGTDGVNTWAAIDPDFNLLSIYPGGFTPRFGSDTRDYSFVAGVKGTLGSKLDWDLSASTGSNRIEYWLKESINLSLGSLSPTEFDNGAREQREQDVNLDFVYQWQTALANPINVGFGLEYRREEFRITAGEYASWAVGPLRDLSPASNGFPGAHPATAGAWDSYNTAAYVDFDVKLTDRLNVGVAGRFEDYSLFGTTTNGKLAARFELTDAVSLRGAVSTGFRAPTPGQQYLQNVAQNPNVNPLVARSVDIRAQLPSNSQAAALFGGKALTPEESVNLSFGVVLQPFSGASVTLDAYRIDVDDRIGLSSDFELTAAQRQQLIAADVPLASELTHVRFYTNSFDTRTTGLDLVANWQGAAGPGAIGVTWASNYNYTEYRHYDPVLLDEQARVTFLKTIPRFTSHLSADYSLGKWQFTARGRHFGEWTYVANTTVPYVYEQIGAETFLDLIGNYQFSDSVSITLGVENALDNYIQEVGLVTIRNNGRRYPGGAPYENEGRQLYARVGVRF